MLETFHKSKENLQFVITTIFLYLSSC